VHILDWAGIAVGNEGSHQDLLVTRQTDRVQNIKTKRHTTVATGAAGHSRAVNRKSKTGAKR